MCPDALGQFELKLRRPTGLSKDRVAREQRSSPAFCCAIQRGGFEEFDRGRFEAESGKPAAKVDVDLDPRPIVLDEHSPAFLWTKRARPRTRLLNKERHFDSRRVQ